MPMRAALTGAGVVRARVWGVWIQRAPALLKAATLHGLRVDDVPGGLEGEVILGAESKDGEIFAPLSWSLQHGAIDWVSR
jgi:hypothetical protein